MESTTRFFKGFGPLFPTAFIHRTNNAKEVKYNNKCKTVKVTWIKNSTTVKSNKLILFRTIYCSKNIKQQTKQLKEKHKKHKTTCAYKVKHKI